MLDHPAPCGAPSAKKTQMPDGRMEKGGVEQVHASGKKGNTFDKSKSVGFFPESLPAENRATSQQHDSENNNFRTHVALDTRCVVREV